MKSTLLNMVSVLAGICLVASACVGAVNMITEKPIELSKKNATEKAVSDVLSGIDFDEITEADSLLKKDALSVIVYRAKKGNEVAAYAVKAPSLTKDGFNGKVTLMVGYTLDGVVNNVAVVEQNETPGLGTKMTEPNNSLYCSVVGKNTLEQRQNGTLTVTKDGGEVEALTAATISSRAYVNAMEAANAGFILAQKADSAAVDAEQTIEQEDAQEGGENE